MADVQEVLIDFKVDYSELTSAQEQLAKGGKIDATQFSAIKKAITSTATDTQGLIKEFKTVATTATKMGKTVEAAFGAGIQDALDEAGVSVEEFGAALTKANAPAKSLREQLKTLREQIAQAKVDGKDFGAEFDALTKKAGQLSDAIADAGAEIKNAGSDTRGLDNVVGSISALAGGFAAAQGAAALFGDENEDVQKALLKVNGAMALASGIQQFYNATLKEGSLTKLADSVATKAQSAATVLYTFVTGGATVATKALRAALLATGIGAIVVLVVALANAWSDHNKEVADAKKDIEDLNTSYEGLSNVINRVNNERLGIAKAAGAQESATLKIQKEGIDELIAANRKLENDKRTAINNSARNGKVEKELVEDLNKTIQEGAQLRSDLRVLDANISAAEISEGKERIQQLNEEAKNRKEIAEKNAANSRAQREANLRDNIARLELDLLAAEKGGEIELDIKKKIIRAKRDLDLNAEKLTSNQILLIKAQALDDQLELQKEFNAKATALQLQAQLDTNNAILAGISIGNEERLRLQLENLEIASQQEITAAQGNAAKILLIEAKKAADIRAIKNAEIDRQLAEDISGVERTNTIIKNGLTQIANSRKEDLNTRVAALRGIESQELLAVDKQIAANEKRIQSDEDYNKKYKELAEERARIEANTAEEIAKVTEDAKAARIEEFKEITATVLQVAGQIAEFFSSLSQLEAEQDQARIEKQKQQLQALVEAGAITEKQAKIRAQEIEILERRAKQRQAIREKQQAVFKAILAIPQAFLQGLSQGGIYLAAIYAALAAAQAAIVASKPVPKFFRGKRDNYAGPGTVADMGSEIVERNGRMYLYTKPTDTYLGARDKVYTAAQTRQILHNPNVNTTIAEPKQDRLDYGRLAAAMPKNSVAINIEKDFISEAVAEGLNKNNHFTRRYKFHK
jgi:hypothetical protein